MSTITFDTLKFSRKLESGGFTREQSIVIAEAVAEVQADNMGQLSTKGDLKELELRMTIKMGAMIIALGGIILTVMRFMLIKGL
jgi:hypothetical protein